MKRFLPTYNEALKLCNYNNSPFIHKEVYIDGYKIVMFNYRITLFSDFYYNNAYEMRGITYVFNKDNTLYKRFLSLHKFFNINENALTEYNKIKNYKIKHIHNKLDGSMITFISLPNGKIIPKTQYGLNNFQTELTNEILDKYSYIKEFVKNCLDNNLQPFFELISPFNKIVLDYDKSNLSLIRVRDNNTGEYLDIDNIDYIGLKAENEDNNYSSLKDILEKNKTLTNKEGVVITLLDENNDELFVKAKTLYYLNLHHVLTELVYRENSIIEAIVNGTIDDIMSNITSNEVLDKIKIILNKIRNFSNNFIKSVEDGVNLYYKKNISMKEFATTYNNLPYFNFILNRINFENKMKSLTKEDILDKFKTPEKYNEWVTSHDLENVCNNYILKMTKNLTDAKDFLEKN